MVEAVRPPPSVTVTVMLAEPFWLAAGVLVTERVPVVPPRVGPGMSVELVFVVTATVRLPTGVSASATVKVPVNATDDPSIEGLVPEVGLPTGAAVGAVIVIVPEATLLTPLSSSVTW